MDDQWLQGLPRTYELGLRLDALGADHELIAACLDLDVGYVPALLEIGARKLEQVERRSSGNMSLGTHGDMPGTEMNQ
jgi:hypothetical protein